MIVERSILAECLNLSGSRINQLVKEGMPKYARGLYDLGACIQWLIENPVKSAKKSSDVIDARKRWSPAATEASLIATRFAPLWAHLAPLGSS